MEDEAAGMVLRRKMLRTKFECQVKHAIAYSHVNQNSMRNGEDHILSKAKKLMRGLRRLYANPIVARSEKRGRVVPKSTWDAIA